MNNRTRLKTAIDLYLECAERMPAAPVGDERDMKIITWIEEMDGLQVGIL